MEFQEYLVFCLEKSFFGVEVSCVMEVFLLPELITIEGVPSFIAGVVNLQGNIIPVIDIRKNFGKDSNHYKITDSVVIVNHPKQKLGIIVNQALGVYQISKSQTQPSPVQNTKNLFSEKIAIIGEKIISLIDIDHIHIANLELHFDTTEKTVNGFCGDYESVFKERSNSLMHRVTYNEEETTTFLAIVSLAGEYFAIDACIIQEFCEIEKVTPVPCCPPHIYGNINLRGDILTLVNIESSLGFSMHNDFVANKIVVVKVESCIVGVIVEEVFDVISVYDADIFSLPSTSKQGEREHLKGTVYYKDKMCTIINLQGILNRKEWFIEENV